MDASPAPPAITTPRLSAWFPRLLDVSDLLATDSAGAIAGVIPHAAMARLILAMIRYWFGTEDPNGMVRQLEGESNQVVPRKMRS